MGAKSENVTRCVLYHMLHRLSLNLIYLCFDMQNKFGNKLKSVLTTTCPQCHKGELFINKNPYKLENWDKMHESCSHCGLKFELEPGFFQGAMYVSYALGVALSVAVFVAVYVFFGLAPLLFLVSEALILIVAAPLIFRYSRSIYMNLFIPFKGN